MKKMLGNKAAVFAFIVPGLLLYSLCTILPCIWAGYYTFFDGSPGLSWKFCGLDNYFKLFQDKQFREVLWVSLKYVFITNVCLLSMGFLIAMMLYFWNKHFKNVVRTIVFLPFVLPSVAVAQIFSKMFEIQPYYGVVNSVLKAVGLGQYVQAWLGQGSTAFFCLCVMDVWVAIGFYAIIFYGALIDISPEVIEAAKIDGAKGFQMLTHILLPMTRSIQVVCMVFAFAGGVKMFESAFALTHGGPGRSTSSLSIYMYNTAFSFNKIGYASVVSLVILLICSAGTAVIRKFDKDLTE